MLEEPDLTPNSISQRFQSRLYGATRRTFESLYVRNFRLFFIGQLISSVGNWLTMVALTLLVFHLTNSGLYVGLLAACQYGPILLLSAWAGLIADRSNKWRLLKITQTLEMGQSFALAGLAFMHHPPLVAIYAVATAGGCMLAFDNPVRRSFVTEMVPKENVPNAVILNSALINVSRIFGPALAGLLVVTVGYGWCFTVDAVTYIAVLLALQMMRPGELFPTEIVERAKGQVREGLRYIRSVPELSTTFAMLLVIGTLTINYSVVFPIFVERGLGGGDGTFTLVFGMFSIGGAAGALQAANRNRVNMRIVVGSSAALGASMLLLSVSPTIAFAFPFALLVGASSVTYMTSTTAIAQVNTDPQMIGRVLSIQTILLIGTTPIGGPFLGEMADVFGSRVPVVLGGLAALTAAGGGYLALRRNPPPGRHAEQLEPAVAQSP